MKSKFFLVLLLGLFLFGCTVFEKRFESTPTPSVSSASNVFVVEVNGYGFNPENLTVPAGSTVKFVNTDNSRKHDVVFENTESPLLAPGEAWEITLDETGRYGYYCSIREFLTGTIEVE